ncbi:hypothetical protein LPW26_07525 [Rhodopseudomonas sp. HC1]|uniref:hypothetical protein n=1 Tax=Rhodopseudomonas infernalis TaxID=2897386 RepID=UPI001EE89F2E|nr:hypothetical protein [Rhodopseudomonas infernalis]MCG6204479.1 hypothetical protein [Rhodopseudomonas infernalis]
MSIRKLLSLACLILAASATTAAADCSAIANAGKLDDGTWLYRRDNAWWPIASLTADVQDGRARKVTFAYVANEPVLKAARRGVLVIKTGVEGAQATETGRVALVRDSYRNDGSCEAYPDFPSGKSVRIRSYDYYHDSSEIRDAADGKTLKAYHVDYSARNNGCKRTDDATPDGYFSFRRRSNRSDFSFNPEVVRGGQNSQFWAQFGFGTAYAEPLAERQVTIKRYAADAGGLACVVFDATLKPGGFIRINDLERRVGSFRSDEQSWAWPR